MLLGLNLKLSEHVIESDDGPLKVSYSPIVDLSMNEFKVLNTGKNSKNSLIMNAYTEERNESEQVPNYTKQLRLIKMLNTKRHI